MSTSNDAMQQQIQSTFQEHHKEIQRRSEISQQGYQDTKSFTKVQDAQEFEFYRSDQKFFVFSLIDDQYLSFH